MHEAVSDIGTVN